MHQPIRPVTRSPFVALSASRQRLKLRVISASLTMLFSAAGGWLLLEQAIVPAIAQAYTARSDVTLEVLAGESFETLMRRAEVVARAAAQRSFDRDILITDVSITVLAQHQSAIVPVLSLTTTRPQWRSSPDPRRWSTYFSSAKVLLGFGRTQPAATSAPAATPVVTPTPAIPQPRSIPPAAAPRSSPGRAVPSSTPVQAPPTSPSAPPGQVSPSPATPGPVQAPPTSPSAPPLGLPALPPGTPR